MIQMRLGRHAAVGMAVSLTLFGCDRQPVAFAPNRVFVRQQKLAGDLADFGDATVRDRIREMADLMTLFFGTPDNPKWPLTGDDAFPPGMSLDQLQRAAGPVGGDAEAGTGGLYRQFCSQCHGIGGAGNGPLARLQDPYPRDFRRGIFKFKATPTTEPPLDADLQRVLESGILDTGMPAFAFLSTDARAALIAYVKYLSVRGIFERNLIQEVTLELDEDEPLLAWHQQRQNPDRFEQELDYWRRLAEDVLTKWNREEPALLAVPPPPVDWQSPDYRARGRELFFSTATNCAQCHGNTAVGDGQTEEYDEWSKELEPDHSAALADYLALGALPPRRVVPRNLRLGVYCGGQEPADFFRRLKHGIAGTTMPTIATELSAEDIWSLVAYVRGLPADPINDVGRAP